jgi:glucose-1-phosphate thymidylyltransferase
MRHYILFLNSRVPHDIRMKRKTVYCNADMKAIVLCGGKGTRLRPLTYTMAKHLIPLANKPILSYVLEQIRDAGITEVCIIIPPNPDGGIKDFYGDGLKLNVNITYIVQQKARGLAHAVKTTRKFLGDSNFLMFLGDNLLEGSIGPFVTEFINDRPDALILLKEVADPTGCGVAALDKTGRILRVIEKPRVPPSNFILVGAYLFTPAIHDAIDRIKPSWRNEYEITDAIQKLIETGKHVRSHVFPGWWLDTGTKDDLIEANHIMLDSFMKHTIEGSFDKKSRITGPAEIRKNTTLENSIIQGPVSIAADCCITSSYIGPYTCISGGTVLDNSKIQNSIIMENCRITGVKLLINSVIGRNVEISKQNNENDGSNLFIGDNSQLTL